MQIEQAKYDEALKSLEGDVGAYAGPYAHVRGDALLRKGDSAGALRALSDRDVLGVVTTASDEQGRRLCTSRITCLVREAPPGA